MPSERDERKWHGYGEQEFSPLRGCTTWSGPVLRQGERVTAVPEARALAAEQRLEQSERMNDILEGERDKAEEARGEAFEEATQRHDDLPRERKTAEQRVAELETQIGGARGRMAELELEATELFAQRNGIDQQRESAEALLAKALGALRETSNAYGCYAGCTGALPGAPADGSGHTPSCRVARAALAEITAASKETT